MIETLLDAACEFQDCDAKTFREYFKELLKTLWLEGEGFDGKRPFGNSDWEFDLYVNLVKHKVVKGKIDEYGYLEEFSGAERKKADEIILKMIESL